MGLDSFLKCVFLKDVIDDFTTKEKCDWVEFEYWRKHRHLHDWMKKLYIKKGGDITVNGFNCAKIRVTIDDLKYLKNDMDWADEYGEDDYYFRDDYSFVNKAISFLEENPDKAFYFHSWY